MTSFIKDIAEQLNDRAEAICCKYLTNGRKSGRYWIVGSIDNEKGDSFVVSISGAKQGKWFENSTGTPGDMLDVVRHCENINDKYTAAKFAAKHLLNLPIILNDNSQSKQEKKIGQFNPDTARVNQSKALFNRAVDIKGTLAEKYLHSRFLTDIDVRDLRFMADCFYYENEETPTQKIPALLQAIRGQEGEIISVNRTYLKADGSGKADVAYAKKVTGNYEGYGVALGDIEGDTLIVGEGHETTSSFRMALPQFSALAGLSMYHTSVLRIPKQIRRLILAQDLGEAGEVLNEKLKARCSKNGIEFFSVLPMEDDFNKDHTKFGFDAMKVNILEQLLKATWSR